MRFVGGNKWLALATGLMVACGGTSGEDTTTEGAGGSSADSATTSGAGAGANSGTGGEGVGAGGQGPGPEPAAACQQTTDAIVAATGNTITVSPGPDGQVEVEGQLRTLRAVVRDAMPGDTVLLEDGTYLLPEADPSGFSGVYITTPDITIRSASGDPRAVVLDSAYRILGGQSAPITVAAAGVVLSGFTVRRSIFHLVHFWDDGDDAVVHDVILEDGGQQFMKASGGNVDGVTVSCSRFEMTDDGRDNVWGYGSQNGNTTCYTGGIDTHDATNWHVHDSSFVGIYCDASGVARPAHGRAPDARNGMTYQGGLAEHAIHMWDAPDGQGHVIERNVIVDCARGIGIGFNAEVHDTLILNNMVSSRFAGAREHDVGISVMRAFDTLIANNTVVYTHPEAYPDGIEYRFSATAGVSVVNNLTNQRIRARDGATASLATNVDDADPAWFVDAAAGDLRLLSCDVAAVVDAGTATAEVTMDLDHDPREGALDIGADECTPAP
ncbi:MAG: hypothetical protein AAGN82_21660 [Myxococcota bacterium]